MTVQKGNILVSSARSGTNYFLSVYGKCFPGDAVLKEIFRAQGDSLPVLEELLQMSKERILALQATNPRGFWKMIETRCAEEGHGCLAKIFYYHVPIEDVLWKYFRNRDRVIHLIRRNQFDVFLSHKLASKTGRWQEFGKAEAPELEHIQIDPTEFQEFLDRQKQHVNQTRAFFKDADYHEVYYEDIATSIEACTDMVEQLYGPAKGERPNSIGLQKQKKQSNSELVANYVDVAQYDMPHF